MTLDLVAEEQQQFSECWLYRCADRSPFAYARGREFIRWSDHALWAHLRDDRLVSVRSGDCLAYRVGDTFYDLVSHEPVYYKPSSFSFPLQRSSRDSSDVHAAHEPNMQGAANASGATSCPSKAVERPEVFVPQIQVHGVQQTARNRAGVILAALNASSASESVLGFAKLFAAMHGSRVHALHVAEFGTADAVSEHASREHVKLELIDGDPILEIVRAANNPQVQLVVVGAHESPNARKPESLTYELAARLHQPLLVVPALAIVPTSLKRVVFPLGGTKPATAAIRALLERLPFDADTELVMLHSYTEKDVPRYADHEPYDTLYRISAFRDRFVPAGLKGPIEFRFGPPQDVVPETVATLGASLVVVSWWQVLASGRAAVVRALLAKSNRPTLLVPADYASLPAVPNGQELDVRDDAIPQRSAASSTR